MYRKYRKELMALAFPLALQNLLNALVGASDALMLGRLNQASIAAVSLANQISFVMSLLTGSVIGVISILVAQYWGKKDTANIRRFMAMGLRYNFGVSLVFFLAANIAPDGLMSLFTNDAEMIRIGSSYLRIVSWSYLFSGIAQCYLMVMKIDGRAKISVWISAMTVVVDMTADFFLIYGKAGIPALGADGSAYSTIAVELIAMVWCLIDSYRKKNIHPGMRDMTFFSAAFEKDIWKILPGMLASALSWGLSMTMHSVIIGHMGTDATAAFSVSNVAQQLISCVTMGIATAVGIVLGGMLGRNMLDEAKEYDRYCWRVALINGVINILLICAVGPLVYVFYALEETAKRYLIGMLLFSALYMFAYSYNCMFTIGVFPSGGDSRYDAISVFFATWCFALPFAALACFVFHWPVMVVYCIMCADEIVKVPFLKWRDSKYIWVKNLTRDELSRQ